MKIFVSALILIGLCLPTAAQDTPRGSFGANIADLSKDEAAALGWDAPRGAKVLNLDANGPAESAGVQPGDILVLLDGAPIDGQDDFIDSVFEKSPGTAIKLTIRRAGVEQQRTVILGTRPVQRADDTPQLMLDTGGHMAKVIDLAVTPDGRQLVSASNDKTVRVWDLASGRTVRVIRGESMLGNWGAIYAMALSPDGRWLAVGGFLSESDRHSASVVRLYDFASGTLVKRLRGHRNIVLTLGFSADGKRLISGGHDKTAIIWDVGTGQRLLQLAGHAEAVNTVAFNKAGTRVVTGGSDGTVRLWNAADGKQISEMSEHKTILLRENKQAKNWSASVEAAVFSPDDRMIASGSEDGRVLLWDGRSGSFLRQLAWVGGMPGMSRIASLSFSPDGKHLLFPSESQGCMLLDIESGKEFRDGRLWDAKDDPLAADRPQCNGPIAQSADGKLAGAGYNSTIHLLDASTAKPLRTLQGQSSTVQAVGFDRDGAVMAWGHMLDRVDEDGQPPLTRRLRLPATGVPLAVANEVGMQPQPVPPPPGSSQAVQDAYRAEARRPIEGYRNMLRNSRKFGPWSVGFKSVDKLLVNTRYLHISKDGTMQTEIDLGAYGGGRGRSPMSFSPDGQTVVVGLGQQIVAYDVGGHKLGAFSGHNGEVRDLVPSPDGRFLLSGASDQTVKLWNLQTRELIVSLYQGADGEWVIWTPQGYYASSPNGDRVVGWQINKGPDQVPDYVSASQLRNKFYRPDIVERAIILASATKAVEERDLDLPRTGSFQLPDLPRKLPPKLGVVSPREGSVTSAGRATIELALAETAGDPVKTFSAFVNDSKVTATAKRNGDTVSIEVPLAQGSNRVRLVAQSEGELLSEAELELVQRGEGSLDRRNTLYIVAIGADKYPLLPKKCGANGDASCDLAYAGADARVFADTIEAQMGKQHLRVVKRVLVNGAGGPLEPTRANIENALDLLVQTNDNDTVAVFIAGHGLSDPRTGYQYLPSDARYGDNANPAGSSVVKWSVLEGAIQAAKGRRLLFVDTCRSPSAFNARLMKDASDEAIVAFSATNTQQDALEMADLGHGVFTNAVVKGLNGAADLAQEREVRVFDLGAYVEREVRKLTKGLQTPDFYKKPGAENFVLARLTDAVAALPPVVAPQALVSAARPARQEDRPVPAAPVSVAPVSALVAPAPAPAPAPPALSSSALTISPAEEAQRLKSGQSALALKDVAGARLIFEFLADRGSAAGAYHLAQTYDPQILAVSPFGSGPRPDAELALNWYQKAAELGHPEAREKIAAGN